MKINYGIVAINKECKVIHTCVYEKEPTEEDYIALYQELREDEELGCVGIELALLPATEEYVESLRLEFANALLDE